MGDVSQGAEPNLRVPDCPALERLLAHAEKVEFATGTAIFRPQTPCSKFLWVLDGSVRVCMHSADGREITLYRMGPNEPCFVCLNNMILGAPVDTYGVAESAVRGLSVAPGEFMHAVEYSPDLARYLLRIVTGRPHEVAALAAATAFDKLELRLACYLGRMFERSNNQPLKLTHEDIARELGTSREVVSRLLKQFEQQGCIRLARGAIEPLAPQELPARTGGNS